MSVTDIGAQDIDHAHALDGLDGVILKIDHQKQMIGKPKPYMIRAVTGCGGGAGDYIESLEDCIPQDSADLTAWDDVEEMCGFLQVYTNVLQQQKVRRPPLISLVAQTTVTGIG